MSEAIFKGRLITGPQLMDALFADGARPSERWLRTQMKRGVIRPIRIGRLVFFDEEGVRQTLLEQNAWPRIRTRQPLAGPSDKKGPRV